MLVIDDAAGRSAVQRALEGPELEVVGEDASSHEAVALAHGLAPDLVLVDIDLPDESGIAIVRALASSLPASVFVTLALSGTRGKLYRAIAAGARGYLLKGMSSSALRRAVLAAARGELAMPRTLAQEVVTQLAGAAATLAAGDSRMELLTAREIEVLALLADGLTDREIAGLLTVSTRTIEAHVGSILRKLGARNRAAATRAFVER
jgi:DNA-binding NarL/FixJ family response regulator